MTAQLAFILFVVAVALGFDFSNGMHDAANSIATIVSTRVLTPLQAVVWAALFNFIAVFLFGTGVAATVGKGLVNISIVDQYVILGGLVGAITWNIITWLLGLPTSSSHAIIAGYAGAAIAKSGVHVLIGHGWVLVIVFLVVSPVSGFVLGALNMTVIAWVFRRWTPHRVDTIFRKLQLVSAALYSIGHGTNDAQKTMGIIAALLISTGRVQWTAGRFTMFGHHHELALWIILSCQTAMALGTLAGGWRIVKTMGMNITRLEPVGGFCAETAGATTLICTALFGIPVSTTHAITGSILGVGTTRGIRSVRWIWGQRILVAWVLTLPCAAFMAALAYLVIHWTIQPLFQ